MYVYYIVQTYRGLASRPYAEARTANMLVRVKVCCCVTASRDRI
jgi:hypothetical protein